MISFLDLQKINNRFKKQFLQKTEAVLDNGWYILGDEVLEFEKSFADYNKLPYAIGVGNGLDALVLVFLGYIELGKLQKGDEVIVPANTYIASILAIMQAGLVPVLVEPSLETYNIDIDKIADKITVKTKAILVVHLYGLLVEMKKIDAIASQYKLIVIEDAAQSHGATDPSLVSDLLQNASTIIKTFSFYPSKNLGAIGDGGAVVTNDLELDSVLRKLRNYGSERKYYNDIVGHNSRLDELQAAYLSIKLPFLDNDNLHRQTIAKRYILEIKNPKIVLPKWDFSNNHVFHLFVILTNDRDNLQQYLLKNNINSAIHYPVAPHKQNALRELNHFDFPISEQIHNHCLSLPISPILTMDEVNKIILVINLY